MADARSNRTAPWGFLLILCLLVLAGGGFWFTTTPYYTLYRLNRAVAARDVATFNRFVDTKSVIQNGVDSLMGDASDMVWGPSDRQDVWRDIGRRLTDTALDSLRPRLQELAVAAVEQQLQNRLLALSDTTRNTPDVALLGVDWQGGAARATIRISGSAQPVAFVMEKGIDGLWRVVVLDKAFLKQLIQMARDAGSPG
ncbi:MAG: DUF2939 domain-containing protein [Candidatus Sericytochromatia bacterium]|nr:DUF2939 domain-containing protein [Candidatus Sericytochromatia bacterium]